MDTNPAVVGAAEEAAMAVQIFENFCAASTMGKILALFRDMCRVLKLKPTVMPDFYTKLKTKLAKSWRAQAIFRKLDVRSNFKIYNRGRTCANCRVLVIGGGPCGLRTAIDAQMLGAKVVVIEKRDRMTRNNIIHLWPYVIQDLRNLAAKKFFGKFCAGAIDHISIRQLQFVLLKVALILGVEFHEGVSFEGVLEPKESGTERSSWKANVLPLDHPVSNYEFDVLIDAGGKRNTLQGFKRKEFRGKLAIAITVNFINKHTKEEAAVPEISGTAFIFKQKFFLDLNKQFYIDLENLVYYKGETHYFVMTAKKQSLLQRNVLMQDFSETTSLLSRENINYAALREYAQDAADYATNFQLPKLEFAVNHYGQPDVAVFDFTSMFAAENASRVIERHGHKLLVCLVGDGLLEPFWPTGSGCARGFLSSLDACWAIRSWSQGVHPLAVIAERESIYRLLAQTTPQNLSPDISHYTVDPTTRYRNLNKNAVLPHQVTSFYDTDDPLAKQNIDALEITPQVHTKKRKRDSQVHPDALLAWLRKQITVFNLELENFAAPFKNGLILCAVLHRYRPDLIEFSTLDTNKNKDNLNLAFDIFEKEFGLSAIPNIEEMVERNDGSDKIAMIFYLTQIYHIFRGEIPFIRHTRTGSPEPDIKKRSTTPRNLNLKDPNANITDIIGSGTGKVAQILPKTSDSENVSSQRKSRKRRSSSKYHGQTIAERLKKLREKKYTSEEHRRKDIAKSCLMSRLEAKSLRMLESNAKANVPFTTPVEEDYNILSYRQNVPEFKERVKELEKLLCSEPERPTVSLLRGHQGGEFSSRIKTLEEQIIDGSSGIVSKKPRDLMRAIGKIEPNDWNFKQIEEKIQENQLGRSPAHGKEKVPKWNREQFLEKKTKIEHGLDKPEGTDGKFCEIDSSLKQLDRQLKEGNVLETGERGKNKVANLAGQFTKKKDIEEVPIIKSTTNAKPIVVSQGKLDICTACKKKVYLMEKITPEDTLVFHKSCFKCHYCSLTLKIGSYIYDREGKYGYNFFCTYHYGMMGKSIPATPVVTKLPPKGRKETFGTTVTDAKQKETSNRGETPERIELENQANDTALSEEPCDEIDEDEWSDINFGNSFALGNESSGNADGDESSSSDDEYSEAVDDGQDESDYERVSDDSQGSDVGSDGEFSSGSSSDRFSYHEYSSGDEEGASGTEGSEQRVARERRRQEVAIQAPPLTSSPTDTEVGSDEESSEEEAVNSATEVSTDSEFAQYDPTPIRELPFIVFNDDYICRTRGNYSKHAEEHRKINNQNHELKMKKKKLLPNVNNNTNDFTKVQVKTGVIVNGNIEKVEKEGGGDIQLEFERLIPSEPKVFVPPRIGDYLLSRTQSTSGIATKRALELKKKYLLGPQASVGLQKSDSASQLDSKFKTFHSNISECQKLLNPAPDISPSMQAFLENSSRRSGSLLSPTNVNSSPSLDSSKQTLSIFNFGNKSTLNTNSSDSCETKPDNTTSGENDDTTILAVPQGIDNTNSDASINLSNDDKTPTVETANKMFKDGLSENHVIIRSQSPVLETSIVVPNLVQKEDKNEENSGTDVESDSLISLESSSEDGSGKDVAQDSLAIPRVEIRKPSGEVMQLDSLMIIDGKYIGSQSSAEEENCEQNNPLIKNNDNKPKEMITLSALQSTKNNDSVIKNDGRISPNSDSGNDITAFFTDNEALDWAVDGTAIDIECNPSATGQRKNSKHLNKDSSWEILNSDIEVNAHVCGKGDLDKKSSNLLAYDHSDIDFMDTGSEESLIENLTSSKNRELLINRGFVEFVDVSNKMDNSNPIRPPIIEAVNHHCDSPVNNDRSMDFIEQGACVLNNDTYLKDIALLNSKADERNSTKADFSTEKILNTDSRKNSDIPNNHSSKSCSQDLKTPSEVNVNCNQLNFTKLSYEPKNIDIKTPQKTPNSSEDSTKFIQQNTSNFPDQTKSVDYNDNTKLMQQNLQNLLSQTSQKTLMNTPSKIPDSYQKETTTVKETKQNECVNNGNKMLYPLKNYNKIINNKQKDDLKITKDTKDMEMNNEIKILSEISNCEHNKECNENVNMMKECMFKQNEILLDNIKDKSLSNNENDVNILDSSIQKKSCNSPKTLRKLEEITKEKVKQKDVIHQLVMDKMSKTSLNSERRLNRRSRSSISPEYFGKKSTPLNTLHDYEPKKIEDKFIVNMTQNKDWEKDNKIQSSFTPEVKLTLLKDEKSDKKYCNNSYTNSKSPNTSKNKTKLKYPNNSEAFSLPDLPQAVYQENNSPLNNPINGVSKEANENRYINKENYLEISPLSHHTGIVPGFRQLSLDDCSGKLVQDVKSLRKSDTSNNGVINLQSKSSGNLYSNDYMFDATCKKNKNRESERRKSIIKTVSDFFKRRDSTGQIEKKQRLHKDKYKSKSCYNLEYLEKSEHCNLDEPAHNTHVNSDDELQPPPVPPLPTNIGQFSGEAENRVDSSLEQCRNICLLSFERNERIKKIQYNLKILEAKEREKRMQYEEAKALMGKRDSYKNKYILEQLLPLKQCIRKLNLQYQIEKFLLDDLLLEDQYFELRLKLLKPMHTKREKINKDMMDIVVKRQYLANNLNQITRRFYSRDIEDDLREECNFLKDSHSTN